jgi:ABC-type transport system involved in multi-copper enzyme maturation permease subunit
MSVYRRGYQRYQGALSSRWARRAVLPRFAWRRLFQQRLVVALTVVAMTWPLLCAFFIYLANNAELLKGLGKQFQGLLNIDGNFFLIFMTVQSFFALFLAALAGPGLIAPDLANNALQLYFSRPLTRLEYATGRLAALVGMLSLVTWIPGLALFGMQAGMAGGQWFRANWKLGAGLFAGFVLWVLLVSMVALASSAYARLKAVSGGLVLGFFFILGGAAGIINGVFRVTWGNALSPTRAAYQIWRSLLGIEPSSGPAAPSCALVLLAIILLLALIIGRKLRPVEVIS